MTLDEALIEAELDDIKTLKEQIRLHKNTKHFFSGELVTACVINRVSKEYVLWHTDELSNAETKSWLLKMLRRLELV